MTEDEILRDVQNNMITGDGSSLKRMMDELDAAGFKGPEQLLRDIPAKYANPDPSKVAQLDKQGTKLDYVGHADITLDLIEADPMWTIDILCNDDGTWKVVTNEETSEAFIFGEMTIHGVTRPCAGSVETHKGKSKFPTSELYKQLYSDLLRNGAMRFGFATGLWSKADRNATATPVVSDMIPAEVAKQYVTALKTLDADLLEEVKKQLAALADTTNIAAIPAADAGAVASIVTNALINQAKRTPK